MTKEKLELISKEEYDKLVPKDRKFVNYFDIYMDIPYYYKRIKDKDGKEKNRRDFEGSL